MKALVPVNILSLVNINLGAVNRRPNLMLMEAGMRNIDVMQIICEQHSKETILGVAIQALACQIFQTNTPNTEHMVVALYHMEKLFDHLGVDTANSIAKHTTKA